MAVTGDCRLEIQRLTHLTPHTHAPQLNGEDIVNPAGDALEEGNAAPPAPDSIVPIPTPKFSQLVQHLSIDIQRPEGKDAEDTTNLHREPSLINVSASIQAGVLDICRTPR